MRTLVLVLTLLACSSCDDREGSNEGAIAGPGISIHCDGLQPRGIGDTSVRVNCAP
jgi:hypothetical protein